MTKSSIVSKVVRVMDVVCSSRTRLSYTDIAKITGLPKSSTHRLLSIMREEKLVAYDQARNVYYPGPMLMGWATSIFNSADLPEISASILLELSNQVNVATGISILDGDNVLWLKIVDAPMSGRRKIRVGERTPVHVCAAGKILLAFLPTLQQNAVLQMINFEPFTHRSIVERVVFEAELFQAHETGIAISNQEELLQHRGISAPVFDQTGDILAAISMWDDTGQRSLEDLLVHKSKLLYAAESISMQLGHNRKHCSES